MRASAEVRRGSRSTGATEKRGGATVDVDHVVIDYFDEVGRPKFRAIENVSLDVRAGEFVCLVGPTGCGKSTLLGAISGLIKHSAGEISINGQPADRLGSDQRAIVFQSASLMPWRTALSNVGYGLELSHTRRSIRNERSRELLAMVGLNGFEERYPHQLSGGMQQRVNLARALAADPPLLLMDEPFAALDAITRETMQQELLRIWSGTGKTVIFVTHQIDEAVMLGDRVVVLSKGPSSRIKAMINIPTSRPRTEEDKSSDEARDLGQQIWALIKEDRADV